MNVFAFLIPKDNTHFLEDSNTIRQALEKFDYYRFTVVPVLDENGCYIGTVSEGDILRFIKNIAKFNIKLTEKFKIKDIEKYRQYKSLDVMCTEDDLLELSLEQNFIPLVDGRGVYIGIVKRGDVIKYLYENRKIKNCWFIDL